jgi:hypothetical protein
VPSRLPVGSSAKTIFGRRFLGLYIRRNAGGRGRDTCSSLRAARIPACGVPAPAFGCDAIGIRGLAAHTRLMPNSSRRAAILEQILNRPLPNPHCPPPERAFPAAVSVNASSRRCNVMQRLSAAGVLARFSRISPRHLPWLTVRSPSATHWGAR